MDSFQAVILAIVQGITEFLPVSSSGHLILVPKLLGWQDQGLVFDVAVHVGTLIAVMAYFRKDVMLLLQDTSLTLFGGNRTEHSQLGWQLVVATIPVGLAGLFWGEGIETILRSPRFIAIAMMVFAVVLWWVDKNNRQTRDIADLNWRDVLIIGCAQAIALMPGVSRSGMTITAALLLGFNRDSAARFSFLMAIPVIILAGGLKTLELIASDKPIDWQLIFLGIAISAMAAFAVIHWFLGFIRRFSMAWFSLYLFALGMLIVFLFP